MSYIGKSNAGNPVLLAKDPVSSAVYSIIKFSDTDFLKLQQRYSQLGNLINKEVSQRL